MTHGSTERLRLLVLGGTTEANALANALAGRAGVSAVLSLAGRTRQPVIPPLPHRIGGFGGIDGLSDYLQDTRTQAVVDATHPFASRISANARAACARLDLPLATFTRQSWTLEPGDRWTVVPDLAAAAAALGPTPLRVFLTTGRLGLAAFRASPQHHYLIRTIDPPDPADLPPDHDIRLARGPFRLDDEIELMRGASIDVLVSKNSGGPTGRHKIAAARTLGLRVVMIEPPPAAGGSVLTDLSHVLAWIEAQGAAP